MPALDPPRGTDAGEGVELLLSRETPSSGEHTAMRSSFTLQESDPSWPRVTLEEQGH